MKKTDKKANTKEKILSAQESLAILLYFILSLIGGYIGDIAGFIIIILSTMWLITIGNLFYEKRRYDELRKKISKSLHEYMEWRDRL